MMPGDTWVTCPDCGGSGIDPVWVYGEIPDRINRKGWFWYEASCEACGGAGQLPPERDEEVGAKNLEKLRLKIMDWQRITFPQATLTGALNHLAREAGECQELDRTRPDKFTEELAEELADCFFLWVQAVALSGVDIHQAIEAKLEKNRDREWKAPDSEGVIEHQDQGQEEDGSHGLGSKLTRWIAGKGD